MTIHPMQQTRMRADVRIPAGDLARWTEYTETSNAGSDANS